MSSTILSTDESTTQREERLQQDFEIPEDQKLFGDFKATFVPSTLKLISGRLYAFADYVCFKESASILAGHERTMVRLAYRDIESIDKETVGIVFPTAIAIKLKEGTKFQFRDMLQRDKAYDTLDSLRVSCLHREASSTITAANIKHQLADDAKHVGNTRLILPQESGHGTLESLVNHLVAVPHNPRILEELIPNCPSPLPEKKSDAPLFKMNSQMFASHNTHVPQSGALMESSCSVSAETSNNSDLQNLVLQLGSPR
mmetsp:Transcript_35086/g.56767  ORF Transcript_35086/g.56767 Transcript_35086/m.56767 type:complete len:258 (-) Transcript_35086:680-1453(-)|eukprot:CAMPEP_0184658740 /NCGR_PEP_ID=MMETSP0308-20130426/26712_1 /TAXON_ID=38269 /ORGANISM="Gloeochaete witrockiana, Strain SAG 46.84" /LENGTH=257 /DNA_ID=CAMNT_0027097965 /DNA_START=23 /DNA_END=796 /DNA_ORIENTATION=-